VERIRAHLGTGSPNTIVRWLDTWWKALPERLNAHNSRLNVANAPEAIQEMAAQWWEATLAHARQEIGTELSAQKAGVDAEYKALAAERLQQLAAVDAAKSQTDEALQRESLALAQVAEMRILIAQLESRFERAEEELMDARSKLSNADVALSHAQSQGERILAETKTEIAAMMQHVRDVEDRSHTEIDRARQESKLVSADLSQLRKHLASERQRLERAASEAKCELKAAVAESASYKAKAAELEGRLVVLQDLPGALSSAIQRLQMQTAGATSRPSKQGATIPQKRTRKKAATQRSGN